MSRVYEHTGVVWSVTSAAVHLQRYIRVIRCISVCICRAMRCIISFRVFFGRPMHNSELAIAPPQRSEEGPSRRSFGPRTHTLSFTGLSSSTVLVDPLRKGQLSQNKAPTSPLT